jgi:hypothetical protein
MNDGRLKQLAGAGSANSNISMNSLRSKDQVPLLRHRPILNKIVGDNANTIMAISQQNTYSILSDHVWWSTDAGATWTLNSNWVSTTGAVKNFTLLAYTNGAWFLGGRLDSGSAVTPGNLFLIRSTDGITWTSVTGNLPVASIGDMKLPKDIVYGLCSDSTSIYLLGKWQVTGGTTDLYWTTDFVTWTGVWGNQQGATTILLRLNYISGRFYLSNAGTISYTTNPKTATTGFYVGGPAVGPWAGCAGLPGYPPHAIVLKGSTYGVLIFNQSGNGSNTFYTSSDGINFSLSYSFPVPTPTTPHTGYSLTTDGTNFYVGLQMASRKIGTFPSDILGITIYRSANGSTWTANDQNDVGGAPFLYYSANSGLIAVDKLGTVKRSTNPSAATPTWTYPTTPGSSYSSEMYIADMADNGAASPNAIAMAAGVDLKTGQGGIWKCTNGLNWTRVYTATLNPSKIGGITYGDGGWVAIDGTGATTFQSTDNGSNWTARATNLPANTGLGYKIAASSNGIVSYVVYAASTTGLYQSSNLTSWTLTLTAAGSLQGLKFCLNTSFVVVGAFSGVYTSTNGQTWSSLTAAGLTSFKNSITNIPSSSLVAIGNYSGDQCLSWTIDLVTWNTGPAFSPANGLLHGDQNGRLWSNSSNATGNYRGVYSGFHNTNSIKASLSQPQGITYQYFKFAANVGQIVFLSDGASIVRIGYNP